MCEKSSMPTDEQIAEFGRQMRKEAKQIVKALKQIQKEAKEQKFNVELWNLAVNVAEGKMKLQEAVRRLKMVIPVRFTNPPCLESRYHPAGLVFIKLVHGRPDEEKRMRSYASYMISSKLIEKAHEFYRPIFYSDLKAKAYNKFTEDNLIGVGLHEKT